LGYYESKKDGVFWRIIERETKLEEKKSEGWLYIYIEAPLTITVVLESSPIFNLSMLSAKSNSSGPPGLVLLPCPPLWCCGLWSIRTGTF
jgi:hypothetical protein